MSLDLKERLAAIKNAWQTPTRRIVENPLAELCQEHLRLNRRDMVIMQSDFGSFQQSIDRAREVARWIIDPNSQMPFLEVCRVLGLDACDTKERLVKNINPNLIGIVGLAGHFQCPVCGVRQSSAPSNDRTKEQQRIIDLCQVIRTLRTNDRPRVLLADATKFFGNPNLRGEMGELLQERLDRYDRETENLTEELGLLP